MHRHRPLLIQRRRAGSPILLTCAIGADTGLYWKRGAAPGGMQTRLVCRRRPLRRREDGLSYITEYDTLPPDVCTDWAWHYSILRIRKSVCRAAIRGSLRRRPSTRFTAMSTTLCFPADTQWMPMATPSISTTGPLTARLPWLAAA